MRTTRSLTATVALAALATLTSSPAMADDVPASTGGSAGQRSVLQAQVEAYDLSAAEARSLQAQVDEVVVRTGGTQVAITRFSGTVATRSSHFPARPGHASSA